MSKRNVKVIGMCGRSGSGKSYVSRKFACHGIPTVDTDRVYREMTDDPLKCDNPCMRELREHFGDGIIRADGTLDRAALSSLVFTGEGAEARRERLNGITHKYILAETEERIAEYASRGIGEVIVDAPLLFESGYDGHCDCIIAVVAPDGVAVRRIMKRDGIDEKRARARLSSQHTVEFLREHADFVLENGEEAPALPDGIARIVSAIRGERGGDAATGSDMTEEGCGGR